MPQTNRINLTKKDTANIRRDMFLWLNENKLKLSVANMFEWAIYRGILNFDKANEIFKK